MENVTHRLANFTPAGNHDLLESNPERCRAFDDGRRTRRHRVNGPTVRRYRRP